LLAATDDAPPIRHDARETLLKRLELPSLAAVKGDAFRILAQPHQTETEIGLVALLVEQQPHQRAADPSGQPGTDRGIQEGGDDEIARDIEMAFAAERDLQNAGQRPQN